MFRFCTITQPIKTSDWQVWLAAPAASRPTRQRGRAGHSLGRRRWRDGRRRRDINLQPVALERQSDAARNVNHLGSGDCVFGFVGCRTRKGFFFFPIKQGKTARETSETDGDKRTVMVDSSAPPVPREGWAREGWDYTMWAWLCGCFAVFFFLDSSLSPLCASLPLLLLVWPP